MLCFVCCCVKLITHLRHISVSSVSRRGRTSRPPAASSTARAHWPSLCENQSEASSVAVYAATPANANGDEITFSGDLLQFIFRQMIDVEWLPPIRQDLLLLLSLRLFLRPFAALALRDINDVV